VASVNSPRTKGLWQMVQDVSSIAIFVTHPPHLSKRYNFPDGGRNLNNEGFYKRKILSPRIFFLFVLPSQILPKD
jgi:hypothetical protein